MENVNYSKRATRRMRTGDDEVDEDDDEHCGDVDVVLWCGVGRAWHAFLQHREHKPHAQQNEQTCARGRTVLWRLSLIVMAKHAIQLAVFLRFGRRSCV